MPARRCSTCAQNWPIGTAWPTICPACGSRLDYMSNAQAMPDQDARSILRRHEFDRWLAQESPYHRQQRQSRYRVALDRDTRFWDVVIAGYA